MNLTRLLERLAKWLAASADRCGGGRDRRRLVRCAEVGGEQAGRCDRDRDLAAADHGAGHRALGLQIEDVDDVAFGAVLQRLAADGEIEPGGLEDQGDALVALHQIRLGEIGGPQRLAGANRPAHLHADRAVARGRRRRRRRLSARRSATTSEDFSTSLRSTSRVSTAASTVSIAVPVKRSLVGGVPASLPISKLTSKRPLRGSNAGRDRLHRAGVGGVQLHVLHVAIEGQAEVGGVAEAVAVLQRAGDLKFDLLGRPSCAPAASPKSP